MSEAAATFLTDPGAWADAAFVAPLIAPGLQAETARRLLASPRLAPRASRWLAGLLGHGDPEALPPADRALALAPAETLELVALCAGAVWHAPRVRALVLGADIAVLRERLGDEVRRFGLRHAALAWTSARSGAAEDANTLAEDIARDGSACLAAWIEALPDWAAARLRLKRPGEGLLPVDDGARMRAVEIVRTVATGMFEVPAP
ncbi:MAG TPA: SctK family type III secretion system sorting platform protein [Acetobacteraceae bacterium]|nr:SctK family type III secretion system sorting platform protein [Acetobacteraceae bacterium]